MSDSTHHAECKKRYTGHDGECPLTEEAVRALWVAEQRFSVRRRCVCTYEERSNGWGCCCAQGYAAIADPDGEFVLVPANE